MIFDICIPKSSKIQHKELILNSIINDWKLKK